MVYPGKRSLGCTLCRERKVKCDERRPGCRRCELYKTQCPGYRRPLEVRFYFREPEEQIASMLVVRRSGECLAPRRASSQAANSNIQYPTDAIGKSTLRFGSRRDEESIPYFLAEYSVPPLPGIYSGNLDFLPNLLASSSPTSALWPATHASAFLALSRRYKSSQLYDRARRSYGTALLAVNESLSQPPHTWQDDLVAAIMLLHRFEDMDGGLLSNRALHMRGIAELYRARDQNLLSKLPGCSLYSWTFSQLQIHAFITHTSYECLIVPEPEPDIKHIPTGFTVLVAKVGRFWSQLTERLTTLRLNTGTHYEQRQSLVTALLDAIGIRIDMDKWIESLPVSWKPTTTVKDGGHIVITYSDQWLGTIWILYNAVQIIFYHGVLQCCQSILSFQDHNDMTCDELIESCRATAEVSLEQLTELVCGSIPYVLGEVDIDGQRLEVPNYKGSHCYNLIWPLALVARSDRSTKDQVDLCRKTLANIRAKYGIHLAESAQDVAALLFYQ
ncbi:hypothetical protein CaCOL14_008265 [Colletotrichum acutatum]|uniref:Zn(2)-C6 fungal-type domain-containing protein n=1 Tax=Glomerella acutata TaxID=27357 RepID=A0AAD8XFL0_GLOAC|nr:uncharacterized protein BDZ83DRAFT_410057 [Colletotrichum acutatum]KAK1722953.1 hypothetical protein BDZ83DRAFT_410057 [Colletotrichum acutatum]